MTSCCVLSCHDCCTKHFYRTTLCVARTISCHKMAVCPSHAGIVSKRLNISSNSSNFFAVGLSHRCSFFFSTKRSANKNRMISRNPEWLSEIFSGTKHRAVSQLQLLVVSGVHVEFYNTKKKSQPAYNGPSVFRILHSQARGQPSDTGVVFPRF